MMYVVCRMSCPECSGMFRNVPECSGMFRTSVNRKAIDEAKAAAGLAKAVAVSIISRCRLRTLIEPGTKAVPPLHGNLETIPMMPARSE